MKRLSSMIAQMLHDAPCWKRVTFMAFCCEPMVSNYLIYRAKANRGSVAVLKDALDVAWAFAATGELGAAEQHIAPCSRQSPDWIDRNALYAHGAADACMAVTHLLGCVEAPSLEDVIDSSDSALWTLATLVPDDALPEPERLNQARLIDAEIARQSNCLARLEQAGQERDAALVRTLQRESEESPPSLTLVRPYVANSQAAQLSAHVKAAI
ncbi:MULTISPECIES: DUF416 family protein [unclassified Lysobacter]|uniref:DUF416 family protein n=1 Tax=unclassified Lysobacter TaxID=2635362 RepID=UPI001BEC2764|nr:MULTISPECIES: DUF416 family protein [unclassified Lysobacter]MBT2748321.1 DUF416 family protein [Lysobacter sp. ISL-42]MBT2749912.1 DUF416 family protein [Lysobacter sp. ISL-50]MBT2781240.1 DUF416 family protein [Lysobacter sp. ISL-52]